MSCQLIGALLVATSTSYEPVEPPLRHECVNTFSAGQGYSSLNGVGYSADCTFTSTQIYYASQKEIKTDTYVLEYQCCTLEGSCCIVRDWCESIDIRYLWYPGQLEGDPSTGGWSFSNIQPPLPYGPTPEMRDNFIFRALQFQEEAFQEWYNNTTQACADEVQNVGRQDGDDCASSSLSSSSSSNSSSSNSSSSNSSSSNSSSSSI